MQVTINIEESQLKEVMEDQLKALKPKDLQKVVSQAIGEYFRVDNYKNLEKLLFKDTRYYSSEKELSPLMLHAVADADYSGLQGVVDAAIDQLKKNYSQILICAVSDMITKGIVESQSLSDKVRYVAAEQIYTVINSNQG